MPHLLTRFRSRFFAPHRCTPALVAAGLMGLSAALSGCDPAKAPATAPGGGMPPAEVGVVTVAPRDIGLVTELPGRLEASRLAQVRARVAGIVQRRLFNEGSDVRAGQPLFEIDAAPYQASYDSAQASVAKAEANLMQAAAQAERYKPLADAKAISQQEYVAALAAHQQAKADVAVAKAALQNAGLNLNHARVNAPLSGRIGRALVTEGALVGQGEATPLALVQQIDPMYVNFTQSATDVLRLRRALDSGQLQRAASAQSARVRIFLDDGSEYPRSGELLFSDLSVDPSTDQVTLRARVPNPQGQLLPGLYVRVRLEQAQATAAVTLPQQAVTRSPRGDTVMVVSAEGKVAPRPVKLGPPQGNQWVVLDGLAAGEQVMVDGFQKLRGDAPVKPVPWQAPGTKAAAPAAAPAAPAASAAAGAAR